jgi:alkaline phosphatase D
VIHLGDYIYEYRTPDTFVRPVAGPETVTLDHYRQRYAQYRTDPDLQAIHAAAPFVVTWDDHEVDNDYAGDHPEDATPRHAFLLRRAAAYRAYYEHMPLRRRRRPSGPDMPLHHSLRYGTLAAFQVLDTRQYRTPQPCGATRAPQCEGARTPKGTILGDAQRRWLFSQLHRSPARWNVLAQQVLLAPVDVAAGPAEEFSMDKWSGYQADREAVLGFLQERRVANPIVITGDIHSNWVCDLKARLDTSAPVVGTEFVGTSIASGGDGQELPERIAAFLPDNPHVRYFNGQRGYVSCTVTPDAWRSDYRIVPFVSRPGAPIETKASFIVESGRPGAQRT